MKTKIIVCYHKEATRFKNEILMPIQTGRAISNVILPDMQGDDTQENISDKNPSFTELRGLFWLWKNVDADAYGLFHYRRLLDINNKYKKPVYPSLIDVNDWNQNCLDKLLEKYDIIIPPKRKHHKNVYDMYKKAHYIKDLDIVIDIIKKDYPQFIPATEKGIFKAKGWHYSNIFIMKKDIFNEYCSWLFDILFKAEKQISFDGRNEYQKRALGYLSERLMNVFLEYKKETNPNIKIKFANLIKLEEEPINKINFGIGKFIEFPDKFYFSLFGLHYKYKKN